MTVIKTNIIDGNTDIKFNQTEIEELDPPTYVILQVKKLSSWTHKPLSENNAYLYLNVKRILMQLLNPFAKTVNESIKDMCNLTRVKYYQKGDSYLIYFQNNDVNSWGKQIDTDWVNVLICDKKRVWSYGSYLDENGTRYVDIGQKDKVRNLSSNQFRLLGDFNDLVNNRKVNFWRSDLF